MQAPEKREVIVVDDVVMTRGFYRELLNRNAEETQTPAETG